MSVILPSVFCLPKLNKATTSTVFSLIWLKEALNKHWFVSFKKNSGWERKISNIFLGPFFLLYPDEHYLIQNNSKCILLFKSLRYVRAYPHVIYYEWTYHKILCGFVFGHFFLTNVFSPQKNSEQVHFIIKCSIENINGSLQLNLIYECIVYYHDSYKAIIWWEFIERSNICAFCIVDAYPSFFIIYEKS